MRMSRGEIRDHVVGVVQFAAMFAVLYGALRGMVWVMIDFHPLAMIPFLVACFVLFNLLTNLARKYFGQRWEEAMKKFE